MRIEWNEPIANGSLYHLVQWKTSTVNVYLKARFIEFYKLEMENNDHALYIFHYYIIFLYKFSEGVDSRGCLFLPATVCMGFENQDHSDRLSMHTNSAKYASQSN